MFDDASRYKDVVQYELTDKRGRTVKVVAVPAAPLQSLMGFHLLKRGQHTDHLAGRYLNNATGFWRIASINEVMLSETLSELNEIAIPNKK
jgi:hypothetical protein